jgi:hypothetical protein
VEFIIDHVHEFDHVLDADADAFRKRLAGRAIVEDGLAIAR